MPENDRMEEFKHLGSDVGRKRREGQRICLREKNREMLLQKKRIVLDSETQDQFHDVASPELDLPTLHHQQAYRVDQLGHMQKLKYSIFSNDPRAQLEATRNIRKLLSLQKNPPIDEVINAGLIPRFTDFLQEGGTSSELQFEAAWALTNVASGTSQHTQFVVYNGGISIFIEILLKPNTTPLTCEQAVWGLGNIAGDSPDLRDQVIRRGAVKPLVDLLSNPHSKVSMMRNGTWALSNLCRGKPVPDLQAILPALSVLGKLLWHDDTEVRTDAAWAISYISDGKPERSEAVLQAGILPRLVELLQDKNPSTLTPCLRTIGNIVAGEADTTDIVIQSGVLPLLPPLFRHVKQSVRKEVCWTVSNIAAGTPTQVGALIHHGCATPLVSMLTNAEIEIRREAAWAICNMVYSELPDVVSYLVQKNVIPQICTLLKAPDNKLVAIALESLEIILSVGDKCREDNGGVNPWIRQVEEDGMASIEALQTSNAEEIYKRAFRILDTYFDTEEIDSFENYDNLELPEGGFDFYA